MAYPYNNRNIPLTDLFDPDVMGDGPTAPNLKVAGVPLRFAHIKYGSKRANVGYTEKGVDVSNKWAAKGTARYALPIDGQTFTGFSSGNISSAMDASAKITIKANGTYSVVCVGNNVVTTPASGTWLPSGSVASGFQVQFVITQQSQSDSGPATITNGAPSYASCAADRIAQTDANVGQHSSFAKGGTYTVAIKLKNLASGTVTTTTITFTVQSVGTA
jgi:hypothetical protein